MRTATRGKILFFNQDNLMGGWQAGPSPCFTYADGMWTLAEAADWLSRGSWPSSYFTVQGIPDQDLKCTTATTFQVGVNLPCNNTFGYTPAYFWEYSKNNGVSWSPITTSSYNLQSNKITLGNSEDPSQNPNAAYQLYGYIDSFRVTGRDPVYTGAVVTPYNPTRPTSELVNLATVLGVNLGSPGNRVVGSTTIPVWTPTIGGDGDIQNIRITTNPSVNPGWNALQPLTQSAPVFGLGGSQPAVQFVTNSVNYTWWSFGSHYNHLRVFGPALTVPYTIATGLDDCCFEGYVAVRQFRHSYNNDYGQQSVFFDTRSNSSTNDGVSVYFQPVNGSQYVGNIFVRLPYLSQQLKYGPIYAGQYYHIAVSKQLNTWRLYVGGIKRDEFTTQLPTLVLSGLTTANNGDLYRAKVLFGALRQQYSNAARLNMLVANFTWPELGYITALPGGNIQSVNTTNPQRHVYTLTPGAYVLHTKVYISNFGGGNFAYQWQFNTDPLDPDEQWQDLPGYFGEVYNTGNQWIGEITINPLAVTNTVDRQGWRLRVRCNDIEAYSRVMITNLPGGTTPPP